MKSLSKKLNEDVTYDISDYNATVDKLAGKDVDKFFRGMAEMIYATGLGKLNSNMRQLYHRDEYLKKRLNFAAWFASMPDVKQNAAIVARYLDLYDHMFKYTKDSTFFGNMNDDGVFATLKVLYLNNGQITHGFDGFRHEFKKHGL